MRPARAIIVRILWDAVVPVSPQRVVMCGKKHTADAVVIIEITINKNFILCVAGGSGLNILSLLFVKDCNELYTCYKLEDIYACKL